MDSSRPSHLIEVLQATETFLRFTPEIRVIHILRIWTLLYNVLENYMKFVMLAPSLQI